MASVGKTAHVLLSGMCSVVCIVSVVWFVVFLYIWFFFPACSVIKRVFVSLSYYYWGRTSFYIFIGHFSFVNCKFILLGLFFCWVVCLLDPRKLYLIWMLIIYTHTLYVVYVKLIWQFLHALPWFTNSLFSYGSLPLELLGFVLTCLVFIFGSLSPLEFFSAGF